MLFKDFGNCVGEFIGIVRKDLGDGFPYLWVVADELTLGYFDFGTRFHQGDGFPHFGLGSYGEVLLAVRECSTSCVLDMWDEFVVFFPGV